MMPRSSFHSDAAFLAIHLPVIAHAMSSSPSRPASSYTSLYMSHRPYDRLNYLLVWLSLEFLTFQAIHLDLLALSGHHPNQAYDDALIFF
jgi:hypothetical protein